MPTKGNSKEQPWKWIRFFVATSGIAGWISKVGGTRDCQALIPFSQGLLRARSKLVGPVLNTRNTVSIGYGHGLSDPPSYVPSHRSPQWRSNGWRESRAKRKGANPARFGKRSIGASARVQYATLQNYFFVFVLRNVACWISLRNVFASIIPTSGVEERCYRQRRGDARINRTRKSHHQEEHEGRAESARRETLSHDFSTKLTLHNHVLGVSEIKKRLLPNIGNSLKHGREKL